VTMLPRHASDGAAGVTWPRCDVDAESCWRRCCWGGGVTVQYICRVNLVTMLLSHAGDGAAGATWSRRDVDAESSRRQCCRVLLAMVLPGQHGHDAM
jgi:hypothetical protein